jgi:hypothetical protein
MSECRRRFGDGLNIAVCTSRGPITAVKVLRRVLLTGAGGIAGSFIKAMQERIYES